MLPFNRMKSEIKVSIPAGNYPVQVKTAIDVGSSAYNQLQKINNAINENTKVSADTDVQKHYMAAWEPKPKRMLKFTLQSGSETFYALENQPITGISEPVAPGLKLNLIGPLICRRGMIFLNPNNVKVLKEGNLDKTLMKEALVKELNSKLQIGDNGQRENNQQPSLFSNVPKKVFKPKGIPIKYKTGQPQSSFTKSFNSNSSYASDYNSKSSVTSSKLSKPRTKRNVLSQKNYQQPTIKNEDPFNDDDDDFFANLEIPDQDGEVEALQDDDDDLFLQIDLDNSNKRPKYR